MHLGYREYLVFQGESGVSAGRVRGIVVRHTFQHLVKPLIERMSRRPRRNSQKEKYMRMKGGV